MKNPFKRAFILPLIVVGAIAVLLIVVKSKGPVDHEMLEYPTRSVEVITAREIPFRRRAVGYGNVEPAIALEAKTEVAGKVSYVHPALRKGGSLAEGTVAIRIEPTAVEFSLEQSKAALAGNRSALSQLEAEQKSLRTSLTIAQRNLELGEKELERVRAVWERDALPRSAVDAEEQKVLALGQQIEDLEGKLDAYRSRKAASKAQIEQSKSQLAQTQDTLGRTEIRLPFDARIGTVFVEEGEFVPVGAVLFEASGTQAVEITAQIPTRRFRPLFVNADRQGADLGTAAGMEAALQKMELEARVTLVGVDQSAGAWKGTLVRVSESIDPTRDTIGLVVAVNDPYAGVIPGKRPPLLKGMYASVEFLGPAREQLALPRKALHQGRVYVAAPSADGSAHVLEIRPVRVAHKQGALVVIEDGLAPGEQVIVTDVIPVLDGLPLELFPDPAREEQLAREALASSPEGEDASGGAEEDGSP